MPLYYRLVYEIFILRITYISKENDIFGGISMLLSIATWISICLVFGMALLQFALTLGAPIGEYALGGTHSVLPTKMKFVSGSFFCLFIVVGLAYLQRADKIAPILNASFVNVLLIIYTLFLAYAIIGNGFLTKSKKEKYVMTPLSIIGCICSVFFLLNS